MRSVETEGGSIDEAIEKALEVLRVERHQVEIEILENSARGLLGFGSRRARIRATVRASLAAKLDGVSGGEGTAEVSRETPSAIVPVPEGRMSRDGLAERAISIIETILSYLVDSPGVQESKGTTDDQGSIRLSLSGSDSGMIIGRRGQTLDALEHLVNRIVFRDDASSGPRISLDAEGYRQRRQESLAQLAVRLAAKARATGRFVTLNPMSPRDRRIVHLALQSDPSVSTRSEGEGHYRKLVIAPKAGRPSRETPRARR
jgi:spoIIIJ-associated protein